jgi:hypothetical protein
MVIILAAGVAADEPAKVAGKWEMSWEGRQGPQTSTLTFEQDGEKLKGTMSGPRGDTPITGTIKGKEIKFSVTRQTPQGEFTVEYTGTVTGDEMKGTFQAGPMAREWKAKRVK